MAPLLDMLNLNMKILQAATAGVQRSIVGFKRKSDAQENEEPEATLVSDSDSDSGHDSDCESDMEPFPLKWNANQVRRKIDSYINSGTMKVGEFQRKLGVSAPSYRNFMTQTGPNKGIHSDTFVAASRFFYRMEQRGEKMPRKKPNATKAGPAVKKAKLDAATQKEDDKYDVSDIQLDGEEDERVPIYDTCDDVRTKIRAHLRTSNMSNAQFLRELAKCFPKEKQTLDKKQTPAQGLSHQCLTTFLHNRGSVQGAGSAVYYGAYVYFEKLRIKHGKAKSTKREEMEERWWRDGGVRRANVGTLLCSAGEIPTYDEYGKFHFIRA